MTSESRHPIVQVAVLLIAAISSLCTFIGIYSDDGPGPYVFKSIRNKDVVIYGRGVYKDMSATVAPQGIAQDVVTLFIGVPVLLLSLLMFRKGSFKGKVALAGVLGYFLVTYLFYSVMGMFNQLYLAYVILMSLSFFSFVILVDDLLQIRWWNRIVNYPVKAVSAMLIGSSLLIGMLWLSIVLPSVFGSIPSEVEHYTTLIVQALDLGVLLPASLLSGYMLLQKKKAGFALASVYMIFLAVLMTALSAKVIAMGMKGENIIPVVYIIPTLNLLAIILASILICRLPSQKLPDSNVSISTVRSYLAKG